MKKFTLDYFINKFEALPRNKWCEGTLTNAFGQHCALGHCGAVWREPTKESLALGRMLDFKTAEINDGASEYLELGKHPKTRVVRYLKSLKKVSK